MHHNKQIQCLPSLKQSMVFLKLFILYHMYFNLINIFQHLHLITGTLEIKKLSQCCSLFCYNFADTNVDINTYALGFVFQRTY